LWTLLKHLRFTHPRFQFTYEVYWGRGWRIPRVFRALRRSRVRSSNPCGAKKKLKLELLENFPFQPSIPVGGPPKSSALLPGFTVSLNTRFDASFELRQPIGRKNSWLGNHLGSGSPIKNGGGKRKHQSLLPQPSRPVWLVTK
jgi:hypothetical protein